MAVYEFDIKTKNIIENMPNGFAVFQFLDGHIRAVLVSDGICKYLKKTREEALEFLSENIFGRIHPDYAMGFESMVRFHLVKNDQTDEQTSFESAIHVRLNDDEEYSRVLVRGNVMTVDDDVRLAMVNLEILHTDMVNLTESNIGFLKESYDLLTGLSSMTRFLAIAEKKREEMLEDGYEACIAYFDMNGMKAFNSKYGTGEGDTLLKIFANVLRSHFSSDYAARLGEDHFVAIGRSDSMENEIRWILAEMSNANEGRTLPVKVGIYMFGGESDDSSPIDACDRARIACDRGKSTYGSVLTWFDREMSDNYMLQNYLLEHLDRALEEGWIHVFVQPVVRVLSGCLCGMEALVRWMDPEHGLIPPNEFIPVLEENGQSYKLDTYVVRKVAEFLGSRLKKDRNAPVVPISVNFSRSDFESVDPVEIVVRALDDNHVRHNLINVEITETALMKDAEEMKNAIDRFHKEGMEVWMDDYGSGYSSLNVLKDFDFDEIKIDMAFLKELNDKSMSIVTSTVQMAKSLGIHTLAEGVETEEQLEFLKSIGCEKIQGYYYGRPVPISEADLHFEDDELEVESREMAAFYDKAGLVDVVSDMPVALFFDDGSTFRNLYENESYKQMLKKTGLVEDNAIDNIMNTASSPMGRRFRDLADQAESSGIEERMVFVVNDRYTRYSFQSISRCRRGNMLLARMDNAAIGADYEQTSMLDAVLRNIFTIYESIYILDFESDMRTVVLSNLPAERSGDRIVGLHEFYENYGSVRTIYPDDIERCRQFQRVDSLRTRVRTSVNGYVADVFRVKQSDGAYKWMEFLVLQLPESDGKRALVCIRPAELQTSIELLGKFDSDADDVTGRRRDYAELWQTLMRESEIMFFWKDLDRRFLGGSRSFMEFCRLNSDEEFVGKTDDELGWYLDNVEYREYEDQVLGKGESIFDLPMQNITRGVLRKISVSELPIYKDGNISGILGYFREGSMELNSAESTSSRRQMVDPVTGLMNIRGLMVALIELDDRMMLDGERYFVVMIDVPQYADIHFEHGDKAARALIRKVSRKVISTFERNAVVARTRGARFVIGLRGMNRDTVYEMVKKCAGEIRNIHEVSGIDCSLEVDYGVAVSTEADNVQAVVTLADNRLEMSRQEAEPYPEQQGLVEFFVNKDPHNVLDSFRDIPVPYLVGQPVMDEEGTQMVDLTLLYANNKYCELTGTYLSELIGKRYLENFPEASQEWLSQGYRAARGEWISGNGFSHTLNHWTSYIMSPSSVPGRFVVMYMSLEDDMKEIDVLKGHLETDRTLIEISRILNGDLPYRKSVMEAISKIGERLRTDRVYIFDIDGWIISNIFEWCAPGIAPGVRDQQKADYRIMMPLEAKLKDESSILCEDTETLRFSDPVMYEFFKETGIVNYMLTPLFEGEKVIGYLGVDNYKVDDLAEARRLIETASYFVTSKILTNKLLERLDRVGNHDELTGVGNRNSMNVLMDEIEARTESCSVGIIYADLNGLKIVNDTLGHAAGDKMLREAADLLNRFCRTKNIFRVGGDEFIVLLPDINRESFNQIRTQMIEYLGEASDSLLALGFDWCENSTRLATAMKRADQKMYHDKEEYYQKHDRRKK